MRDLNGIWRIIYHDRYDDDYFFKLSNRMSDFAFVLTFQNFSQHQTSVIRKSLDFRSTYTL